jgi:hypothetical protein
MTVKLHAVGPYTHRRWMDSWGRTIRGSSENGRVHAARKHGTGLDAVAKREGPTGQQNLGTGLDAVAESLSGIERSLSRLLSVTSK